MNALAALGSMSIDEYIDRVATAVAAKMPVAKRDVERARSYNKKEVAALLGISTSSLDNLIRKKNFRKEFLSQGARRSPSERGAMKRFKDISRKERYEWKSRCA